MNFIQKQKIYVNILLIFLKKYLKIFELSVFQFKPKNPIPKFWKKLFSVHQLVTVQFNEMQRFLKSF